MSDVVSFIRARLDEHAETARRAIGVNGAAAVQLHQQGSEVAANYPLPVWSYDAGLVWQHDKHTPTVVVGHTWDADGAHIALNDPVHVLSWVAALRTVVDVYEPLARIEERGREPYEYAVGLADALGDVVRQLAAVWRTHPDYEPTWAPGHVHDFGPDRDRPCPCGYPAPPF